MPTVVVAEPFAESGLTILREGGVDVISCIGAGRDALLEQVKHADGLIVRSETRVDRDLLQVARALQVVGRAGVGVDAIDVGAATEAGIIVLNTPAANTLAATEQTFALLLAVMRHVPAAVNSIKEQRWERGPFIGNELFGKIIGIVGLGRIGGAVATRAQAFGMHVIACDPYVAPARAQAHGVTLFSLDELLARSDIVTLHVPMSAQTKHLIDAPRLSKMKPGSVLVNCARGGIIDEDALLAALERGTPRVAAIDVVADEPPVRGSSGAALHTHPRVIATPHLGGSTHEALARIASELASDLVNVLNGRPAEGAVNAPSAHGPGAERLRPYVDLAYRIGVLYPQLGDEAAIGPVELRLQGDLADADAQPLATAFFSGLLQRTTERRISMVNADAIARERGLTLSIHTSQERDAWSSSIAITTRAHSIVGTVLHHGSRIVELDGFEIDAQPQGCLIFTRHQDIPGMIGRVGMVLGDAGVNISTMQVARAAAGEDAMMVLAVDRAPAAGTIETLALIPGMLSVRGVTL